MTDFKTGDKVRYTADGYWAGIEGTVLKVQNDYLRVEITHRPLSSSVRDDTFLPFKCNLELIEPQFSFKDIQKGDVIRRTFTRSDGTKVIWEGAVHRITVSRESWVSEKDFTLCHKQDDQHDDITLELVDRPKPTHWAHTKPVGSIVITRVPDTPYLTVYRKVGDTAWTGYLAVTGVTHNYTSDDLAEQLRGLTEPSEKLEYLK